MSPLELWQVVQTVLFTPPQSQRNCGGTMQAQVPSSWQLELVPQVPPKHPLQLGVPQSGQGAGGVPPLHCWLQSMRPLQVLELLQGWL